MDAELLAFGISAFALGVGILYAARRLYPRLEFPEGGDRSVRLLTALIAALLVLLGLGLVVVALLSS